PIRRAIGHFDRISQNVLTDEIDISGRDESGRLMHALATMQAHLKAMMDDIRLASMSIDDQCRHLTEEMHRVLDQSREQRDRVQSVAAASEQFTQSVAEVADSAGKAAATAADSRAIIGSSTINITSSVDATARVVDAVQASSTNIGRLSDAIQKIGDITNTIKEIADQTNLLALNAAIEAARAGEQGRGFAVVADEVRKLAERTALSTNDITATVAEFRSITETAVGGMSHAVLEVEEGIGKMRASVGGLDRIMASSDDVARMAEHIAAAANQQASASHDVATDMETISTLIDQNTSVAQKAGQTVEGLSRTAGGLKAMVDQFKLVKGR
ncbi:MAG: HAMP domain-containing methyl-accepting chemotaxis protein, partial [Devosia sp.]|nr:HAMP domain-containing methyl-accepting chemotaxis protein [Devosia sp.]